MANIMKRVGYGAMLGAVTGILSGTAARFGLGHPLMNAIITTGAIEGARVIIELREGKYPFDLKNDDIKGVASYLGGQLLTCVVMSELVVHFPTEVLTKLLKL